MMESAKRARPHGHKAYRGAEDARWHLEQVRRFLAFINQEYETGLALRADLLPLLWDRPVREVQKRFPEAEQQVLPSASLEELRKVQKEVRGWFEFLRGEARKPQGFSVSMDHFVLCEAPVAGEKKVYRLEVRKVGLGPRDLTARLLIDNLARHLVGLSVDVIRRCEWKECGKYFLDPDLREARHCSQPCRYLAYDDRRKRPKRRKSRKRGIPGH